MQNVDWLYTLSLRNDFWAIADWIVKLERNHEDQLDLCLRHSYVFTVLERHVLFEQQPNSIAYTVTAFDPIMTMLTALMSAPCSSKSLIISQFPSWTAIMRAVDAPPCMAKTIQPMNCCTHRFQIISHNLRHAMSKTNATCDFSNRLNFVLLIYIRFVLQRQVRQVCFFMRDRHHEKRHSILQMNARITWVILCCPCDWYHRLHSKC